MGFFDKIADKAKGAAESAKKTVTKAYEETSSATKELSEKASAGISEFSDKASKEFSHFSKKASEEGSNFYGKISDGFSSLTDSVGTSAKELSVWAESMPAKLKKMADDFDADAMWDKLSKTAAKAGQELIVMVLTIYYAIESKIPGREKKK